MLMPGKISLLLFAALQAAYRDSIPGTLVSFEMIPVPGGSVSVDTPQGPRTVTVAPFWIGKTEVTWDEFDVWALRLDAASHGGSAVDATARPSRPYGAPDRGFGHKGYPAISMTYAAAQAYCAWLSAKTGKAYRLPTDAEWTLAARTGLGPDTNLTPARRDTLAWHAGNAAGKSHAAASRAHDLRGLYDMLGNAAEWVTGADGRPVVRGGSWADPPERVGLHARALQTPAWNESDPQLPKSHWWLTDGPFVGSRIVREP